MYEPLGCFNHKPRSRSKFVLICTLPLMATYQQFGFGQIKKELLDRECEFLDYSDHMHQNRWKFALVCILLLKAKMIRSILLFAKIKVTQIMMV